jgi:dienelactone hydrolase
VSEIDASVQAFAVTPRSGAAGGAAPALVLTLHGANVEATNQAAAYAAKDWATIVAPTNRRPFGFDWEDWGRLDALEVLARAEALFGADPRRVYLTGHSMGGHGTWQIGAHFAARFAAIAPSAGWIDFWSYTGAAAWSAPTAVESLLVRAANPSRTLLLERNLAATGIYVLHGAEDDNVPVTEARAMRARLAAFHPDWVYHEEPGAGHWWGNECVDWPPLFAFFADRVRPEDRARRQVDFTTVNPAVSARSSWVTIEAQERALLPSRVEATIDPARRAITARAENVTRLAFDLGPFVAAAGDTSPALEPGAPLALALDDRGAEAVPWPDEGSVLHLARDVSGAFRPAGAPSPDLKGPARAGPFKEAFRNRMLFVYGTRGSPAENAWAFAKARFDAETFLYRGNGSVDLVPDVNFDAGATRDRNVILYGNATTNTAWPAVLPAACPLAVRRGGIAVGARRLSGEDLACLFIYPRVGSAVAAVGVVAGTGPAGMRLTDHLPVFVSGVAYPDWIVLGAEMLERGSGGVRGAGFFGDDWSLERGESAWRDGTAR